MTPLQGIRTSHKLDRLVDKLPVRQANPGHPAYKSATLPLSYGGRALQLSLRISLNMRSMCETRTQCDPMRSVCETDRWTMHLRRIVRERAHALGHAGVVLIYEMFYGANIRPYQKDWLWSGMHFDLGPISCGLGPTLYSFLGEGPDLRPFLMEADRESVKLDRLTIASNHNSRFEHVGQWKLKHFKNPLRSTVNVSPDRRMDKAVRPMAMLILHKTKEHTTCIQPALLPLRRPGFNPRMGHSGFSHVGIAPGDAVGRRAFSGAAPYSSQSPSSALKTSIVGVVELDLLDSGSVRRRSGDHGPGGPPCRRRSGDHVPGGPPCRRLVFPSEARWPRAAIAPALYSTPPSLTTFLGGGSLYIAVSTMVYTLFTLWLKLGKLEEVWIVLSPLRSVGAVSDDTAPALSAWTDSGGWVEPRLDHGFFWGSLRGCPRFVTSDEVDIVIVFRREVAHDDGSHAADGISPLPHRWQRTLCETVNWNPQQRNRRRTRTDEGAEVAVLAAVSINPHVSTRQFEATIGIPKTRAHRIHKRLTFHPYHAHLQHKLHGNDFQNRHDACPAHSSVYAHHVLDRKYTGRWIGRGGPVQWPARSHDLNPLDVFLWGYLKSDFYRDIPTTPKNTQESIGPKSRSCKNLLELLIAVLDTPYVRVTAALSVYKQSGRNRRRGDWPYATHPPMQEQLIQIDSGHCTEMWQHPIMHEPHEVDQIKRYILE
ncbi:hypothetical protein PR048_008772 [Dryococelus australis]|uniref:DUF2235 domain-containing protein n=1 Tax=Dryococelus australis TaxID=614101 RepID=A0ABQ9HY33_9NEOP|nr:hypothetical protein PR048_008772 [Dryococelus australis]